MSTIKVPLRLRLKLAGCGLLTVLRRPLYLLLALGVGAVVMGVLLWLLNFNLLIYIFSDNFLSPLAKMGFLLDGYASVFTNFEAFSAVSILIISVLMGLTVAVAVHIGRSQALATGRRGAGAMVAALVGSGCAVCGTSILGPLLSGLVGGAAASVATSIGQVANTAAIALLAYSLVGLAAQVKAGGSGALASAVLPSE